MSSKMPKGNRSNESDDGPKKKRRRKVKSQKEKQEAFEAEVALHKSVCESAVELFKDFFTQHVNTEYNKRKKIKRTTNWLKSAFDRNISEYLETVVSSLAKDKFRDQEFHHWNHRTQESRNINVEKEMERNHGKRIVDAIAVNDESAEVNGFLLPSTSKDVTQISYMSLGKLPKDCLYHLMTFLPCPVERQKLVFAIRTTAAQQAFEEPSLWRVWKDFNVTDRLFLRFPKAVSLVLDHVKRIETVRMKLPTEYEKDAGDLFLYLFPMQKIVRYIEESANILWDAKKLEIDAPDIGYNEGIFVKLLAVIYKRLGNKVATAKLHINERALTVTDVSGLQIFFNWVLDSDKFRQITSLDLNSFGVENLGSDFTEVLGRLSIKYLKISGLHDLASTCLNRVLTNLEELSIVDCDGIISDNFIHNFGSQSFPIMKEVNFTCKRIDEGMKWNAVCRRCFQHCSFTVVVTEPMGDRFGYTEDQEHFALMKEMITLFVQSQVISATGVPFKQNLTLGQPYPKRNSFSYYMVKLLDFVHEYEFAQEGKNDAVLYKVRENSTLTIYCKTDN